MIKQPPNMTLAKDSSLAYPGPVPDAIQGSGKIYFNYNLSCPLSLSLTLLISYITCSTVTN
jgi:hypothetical protein